MREESENSTTASVASASFRTVELVGPTVRSSSTRGPARTPMATTTIAGVIGVLDSRRETAATSSSASPTVARPQSTAPTYPAAPYGDIGPERDLTRVCSYLSALAESGARLDVRTAQVLTFRTGKVTTYRYFGEDRVACLEALRLASL